MQWEWLVKIFWSWQSDRPTKTNRGFIREALEEAIACVAQNLDVIDPERFELDHDTKNVPGMAAITDTIFGKIKSAGVFVGDLSYVGKTEDGSKMLPNSNVLLELGHAISCLGPDRIIVVANSAFGGKPEDLPFDLRHRRAPIAYRLPPGAGPEERARAFKGLVASLAGALQVSLGVALQDEAAALSYPMHPSPTDNRALWLPEGAVIEHADFFHDGPKHCTPLAAPGPRFYLRVIPARYKKTLTGREVHDLRGDGALPYLGNYAVGDGGANLHGAVSVAYKTSGEAKHVIGATQWFKDTGEVWAFNGRMANRDSRYQFPFIAWADVARAWHQGLEDILRFMDGSGATGPFRVEAGATCMAETIWTHDFQAHANLEPAVYLQRDDALWSDVAKEAFSYAAFNLLAEAYNQPAFSLQTWRNMVNAR
jgi:hypothetical protein